MKKTFTESDLHLEGVLPPLPLDVDKVTLIATSINWETGKIISTVRIEDKDHTYDLDYSLDIKNATHSYESAITSIRNRLVEQLAGIDELNTIQAL